MLHIFVKLARVITMCNSNGLLFNIRVIFLILAREIVMALVFFLGYGGRNCSHFSFFIIIVRAILTESVIIMVCLLYMGAKGNCSQLTTS